MTSKMTNLFYNIVPTLGSHKKCDFRLPLRVKAFTKADFTQKVDFSTMALGLAENIVKSEINLKLFRIGHGYV